MKKRIWCAALAGILLLSGCGNDAEEPRGKEKPIPTETQTPVPTPTATPEEITKVPEEAVGTYFFSSGVGAWYSELHLQEDGTFAGEYQDTNAGESGDGYLATIYRCAFEGKFKNIKQIDAYSYAMTLAGLQTENPEGKAWIEEEVRYVASVPYGLEEGTEFILYTPETPVSMVSEEFLNWWPKRYDASEKDRTTLGYYGIYNVATEQGFFMEG